MWLCFLGKSKSFFKVKHFWTKKIKGVAKMKKYTIKRQDSSTMDVAAWMDDYQKNPGRYWKILRQRIRVRKYSLEYGSEVEDLMQESIEQLLKVFARKKELPTKWIYTSFKLAATNALNIHIRQYDKYACNPSAKMKEKYEDAKGAAISERSRKERMKHFSVQQFGFVGDGERTPIVAGGYSKIDMLVDLGMVLDSRQMRIVKLLNAGYRQTEIANIFRTSQQQIYREVKRVRRLLQKEGFMAA